MTTQNRWDFEKIDTLVKVALGLGAVLVYGVVRVTVNAFYDKLGLTAETVGIGQAEILGRSALYLAFFAVVAVPTAFAASFVLSRFLPKSIRGDETIRMQWSTLLLLILSFPAVLILIPDFASFLRRGLSPASYEMGLLPHLWRALPLSLVLFAATWLWITLLVLNRLWTAVDSKDSRGEPGVESVGSTPRGWAKRINHALDAAIRRVRSSRHLTIFALAWLPFMIILLEWTLELETRYDTTLGAYVHTSGGYYEHTRSVWLGLTAVWLVLIMASINWSLSRARIKKNPDIGINQFLRKPSTIAALGLAAFTTLLLAQVAGEYLATKVQDGETVEGSRYGLLSVRADHICLSWPRQSGIQQAQDAQKADPSQRPYRKLTGPFIYLGKSGDDLVLYDFLRLTAGDEWLNQGEGPGGLLRIPKGNSIVTQVALPGGDLEIVTSLRNSFPVDVQGANAARQRLTNECSEVNAEMFPD